MGKANFPRYWQVKAASDKEQLTFGPLAIKYDWARTADTQPGEMKLSICNLNPEHRAFVERKGCNIELDAGYTEHHGLVFKGAVEFGSSSKQNGSRWTELTVKDGAIHWRNLFISKSFAAETDVRKMIEAVLNTLTGLPKEIQAEFQEVNKQAKGDVRLLPTELFAQERRDKSLAIKRKDSIPIRVQKKRLIFAKQDAKAAIIKTARGEVLRGAAMDKLTYLCNSFGLTAIQDLQTIHIVPDEFALAEEAILISPGTGLIGSPKRITFTKVNHFTAETGWEFDCTANHELRPGGLVYLDSDEFSGPLVIARLEGHGQSHDGGDWKNTVKGMEYDTVQSGTVLA